VRTDPFLHAPRWVELQLGSERGSRQLEWEDGQLWFRESPHSADHLHRTPWQAYGEPSAQAWSSLRARLDASAFWDLPTRPAAEGARWRLALRWGSLRRAATGSGEPPSELATVIEAVLGLRDQPSADYPPAFRLRCDWPGGEEHFGWDGRHLDFAAFLPRPRIHEGQRVPAAAWKGITPLLEAGRPLRDPAPPGDERFLIDSLYSDCQPVREVPGPLRHDLRRRLKDLLPADCRLDGVPGTGLLVEP